VLHLYSANISPGGSDVALSLREAVELQDRSTDLTGIPLRRSHGSLSLLAEIAHLKETLAAKDAHIHTLQTQLSSWRAQAMNEATARNNETRSAYQNEADLIRIIHRQMMEIEILQTPPPPRRRWFGRS
jgi:hypothetical protein